MPEMSHSLIPAATEHEIQQSIMHLLTVEHVFAFRLNTAKIRAEHKGKSRFFQAHSLGKGAADIRADILTDAKVCANCHQVVSVRVFACPRCDQSAYFSLSIPLWIEVKRPGQKQTPEQVTFQMSVEALGQCYLLATSVDEVMSWLRKHGGTK